MAEYDEREEELSSIAAIFPELVIDADNAFAASIDLAVAPSAPLTVRFPAAPPPSPPGSDDGKQTSAAAHALGDQHRLEYLPPLHLQLLLPEAYPAHQPPSISISTDPGWLPVDTLRHLAQEVHTLWEEYGKCQILYSYIDYLQQAAERAFDLADPGLDLSPALKPAMLDYDASTRKHVFDSQTFDCGVCLEPKKGSDCYRIRRCAHVFCRDCLQEAYNNYITEGNVIFVRCLDPTCGKQTDAATTRTKPARTLHPRDLLDMGIDEPTVRRYVDMKRKKKLEADKSTIYCPRSWCQGPARSAKYPPLPADLRQYPDDSDSEPEDQAAPDPDTPAANPVHVPVDRLCICSKCTFAFCRVCYAGWHGDFARCWPRNPAELTDEEKATYDYIREHTSPCPTCSTPTQKTMGCNHMICFQCQSHFCYLCSSWLEPDNPYQHFNRPGTQCYQKLWELEEGDEGQGNAFGGARMYEAEARRIAEEADREEAERLQNEQDERAVLMDAEGEADHDGLPLRRHGRHPLPEAPAPPPGQLDPELAAQFARLQVQMPLDPPPQHHQPAARGRGRNRGGWHLRANARGRANNHRGRAAGPRPNPRPNPQPLDEEAAAAGIRRFVELAARDQEEEWDSDELDEEDERWELRLGNERAHGEPH